jgi:D-beta-D-heptose 7-phosphate kinase/D-beta-D-heptose 1-phosphate adenosyltransferase
VRRAKTKGIQALIILSCLFFIKEKKTKFMRTICVSGYFDPVHVGHLEYLKKSRALGDKLVVIVNNDRQAQLKKGKSFMPEDERVSIIRELRCVDEVFLSIDEDRTVCQSLRKVRPDVFTNGGDQTNSSIPEQSVCQELGIELSDGHGAKIQSSSWLTGLKQCALPSSK